MCVVRVTNRVMSLCAWCCDALAIILPRSGVSVVTQVQPSSLGDCNPPLNGLQATNHTNRRTMWLRPPPWPSREIVCSTVTRLRPICDKTQVLCRATALGPIAPHSQLQLYTVVSKKASAASAIDAVVTATH